MEYLPTELICSSRPVLSRGIEVYVPCAQLRRRRSLVAIKIGKNSGDLIEWKPSDYVKLHPARQVVEAPNPRRWRIGERDVQASAATRRHEAGWNRYLIDVHSIERDDSLRH